MGSTPGSLMRHGLARGYLVLRCGCHCAGGRGPRRALVVRSDVEGLDDPDGVELGMIVDPGQDLEDAELFKAARRELVTRVPVKYLADEHGRVCRVAMLEHERVTEARHRPRISAAFTTR